MRCTPSSRTPTTPRCRRCAAWWRPACSDGSRDEASTTTAADAPPDQLGAMAPTEPPPTPWQFPSPAHAPDDLVCLGADLEPGTLLAAYRRGLFPMPYDRRRLGWWSPNPRGILPYDRLRVSRSLRRSAHRYEVRIDTAFRDVVTACASTRRRGGWITPAFIAAYHRLHELGWT